MRDRLPRLCPHCSKPLQAVRFGVPLGPIAARIIDEINRAGRDGISSDDLFARVYGTRNGATIRRLKTYIANINSALAPRGLAIRVDRFDNRITLRKRAS